MPRDIQDVLAYEIKKEIADRYFGFRKLIEEDSMELAEKNRQYSFILEKRISFDLIRIYLLLKEEEIIHNFLQILKLNDSLFFDPYIIESATIKQRVFEKTKIHGLTWQGRYFNLIFDIYERLVVHVGQYWAKHKEMTEFNETISEEIKIFYRNNDIGNILGFLRSMGDSSHTSNLQGGMEPGMAQGLEEKLKIKPPELPSEAPSIHLLPPLKAIKADLKKLAKSAYILHGKEFRTFFENLPPAP